MLDKCKLAVIFMLLCFCFSVTMAWEQAEKYKGLLGTWDVQTEGGSYEFVFRFSLEEDILVGKFTGSSGDTEMENLTFEDNKLSFSVDINGMIIDFAATIDSEAGSMEGMLSLEYGEANITGERRKE